MMVSTGLTQARRSNAALALDPLPASKVQSDPPEIAEFDKHNSETSEMVERNGRKMNTLLLTRGKSGYDALLKWKSPNPEPDLAGYVVLMRKTTAP